MDAALVQSLGYLGFTSPNADAWATFGPDVLGLQAAAEGPDGSRRFRIDDHAWRLALHPGETDDLAYVGWEVDGPDALTAAVDALAAAGCDVHTGDAELAATRGVDDLAWFLDPFGFRHELAHGFAVADGPFAPGQDGVEFVTGEGGLGHLVLMVGDLDDATSFFVDTMGFTISDDIDMGLLVRFLHCNPRHHSLAFTALPGMAGVHHLMLEISDPDEVGKAYDRVKAAGHPVAMTIGKHTNDRMFSFYVRSPSGFEIEYGSGGRLIDTTASWTAEHYDAMSIWGHRPPPEPLFPGILRAVEGDASA